MAPGAPRQRLAPYRAKRDFARTAEPSGGPETPGGEPAARRFVVQRHRASRLHYDFRLEVDGVLVSWAVPKGPTLDPAVRRGAYHVEDHPLEYIDFEGVIPSGEYGGGDVIVWDTGTWTPVKPEEIADPDAALRGGELHVVMDGVKLRGQFVLVRTERGGRGRESWLLLHKHDGFAVDGWDPEEHPRSVLTGRTNDEVQADPDRLWRSDLPARHASIALRADAVAAVDDDALGELDALGASGTWHVFGRAVRLTGLDDVAVPAHGRAPAVGKRDLVRHAAVMAPVVLPYLTRRAFTARRAGGSWRAALPARAPDWLPRGDDGGTARLVVDEPAALVWAVNAGALEWYAGAAGVDDPDRPTAADVGLDPGGRTAWADAVARARLYRTALEHLGLRGRLLTDGAHGLRLRVPVAPGPGADAVREWVGRLAATVAEAAGTDADPPPGTAPDGGLLVPYSPRALPGAPVAAPLDWDELDDPHVRPARFTIRTVADRVAQRGDLFDAVLRPAQHLPPLG